MKLFVITGTCGAGKSTMKDALAEALDKTKYACVDADEVGLNWWDYKGTERFNRYEQIFENTDVKIIYFPYTQGTSSSQLRNALSAINNPTAGNNA